MNPIFFRSLLAILPLLALTLEIPNGFLYGGMGMLLLFLIVLIFFLLHFLLPSRIRRVGLLLLFGGLTLTVIEFLSLSPLLLISLFVLIPTDAYQPQKSWWQVAEKTFLAGLSFWLLLGGHGLVMGLLGKVLTWRPFELPLGSYLLLGSLAVFFPREKSE